jgi:hypothetical protein
VLVHLRQRSAGPEEVDDAQGSGLLIEDERHHPLAVISEEGVSHRGLTGTLHDRVPRIAEGLKDAPAGVSDSAAGLPLLTQVAADNPAITKAWADSAYRSTVVEGGAALGIDVEVVRRDPATRRLPFRLTVG